MAAGTRVHPACFVGTSGFSYPAWRGPFYPAELPAREFLSFYAGRLPAVEINNTFYRMPDPAMLRAWTEQTPAAFRFALKAPQSITHRARLKDADGAIRTFVERAATLGERRGPLLFQLPPNLPVNIERLTSCLRVLATAGEVAFEFRHPSWLDEPVFALLEAHGAALCIADTEDGTTPLTVTAPFGYVRLRREDYAPRAVTAWAQKIAGTTRWERVYVFLKHEDAGRAPALATALGARLSPAA